MTKKLALAFFLAFAAALVCYADEARPADSSPSDPQGQPAAIAEQSSSGAITGMVEKVDLKAMKIAIKDATTNEKVAVRFNESTTFRIGGNQGTVSELKKGDNVVIQVNSEGIALSVDLQSKISNPPGQEQPEKE